MFAMGPSRCSLCGIANGNAEFTDSTYLWPEGLANYVLEHPVRLPREVLDHVGPRGDELISTHDGERRRSSMIR